MLILSRKSYRRITEQQVKQVISEEWARAKELCPRYLKKMPKLYWGRWQAMRNNHGWCYRQGNTIAMHAAYLAYWHLPEIRSQFILTLRHEFAHLTPSHAHDEEWVRWNDVLGGSRWAFRGWKEEVRKATEKAF